jgi:nitrate/nitrite transporter NarK
MELIRVHYGIITGLLRVCNEIITSLLQDQYGFVTGNTGSLWGRYGIITVTPLHASRVTHGGEYSYIYIYIYICVCVCIYIYIYICIYIYI